MKHWTIFFPFSLAVSLMLLSCSSEPEAEVIQIGNTIKVRSSYAITDSPDITFYWSYSDKPTASMAKIVVDHNQVLFTPDISGKYSITCTVISPNDILHQDVFLFSAVEKDFSRSGVPYSGQESAELRTEKDSMTIQIHDTLISAISESLISVKDSTADIKSVAVFKSSTDESKIDTNQEIHSELDTLTSDLQDIQPHSNTAKQLDNPILSDAQNNVPEISQEPPIAPIETDHVIDNSLYLPKLLSPGSGRYSIQISSWATQSFAEKHVSELKLQDIPAHVERIYMSDSDRIWFRVRVGDFRNLDDAKKGKLFIESKRKQTVWIDRVKKRN